jgi:anti-sigma factor ChrR (cupin superfamily)
MKNERDDIRELAALYALGQLSAEEARAFEARLAAGDQACRSELAAVRSVVDDLAYGARPEPPPPRLRARLLERIVAAEPAVIDQGGLRLVRSGRFDWEPAVAQGIEVKRLFEDSARRRVTMLVRLAPGASYPAHRHADVEELYLLEGEVFVSGVLMRAGDYCHSEADTVHDRIHTSSGCLFIATASQRNQYLA